jgi:hypothetical protein
MRTYSTAQTDKIALARMLADHAERIKREDAGKWICEPCKRNNHAWCTMIPVCECPNNWDGEAYREIARRKQGEKAVEKLTRKGADKSRNIPEPGPLQEGRGAWSCSDCGYESPWWKGCERFKYCTDCEQRHRATERRELQQSQKARGLGERNDVQEARAGGEYDLQRSLPLPAHRDGKGTD